MIKVGSDFSGVGAFDQALIRLGVDYKTVYACDWDKYSRQTYIHNYGEPDYYPEDVYDREIPEESLDVYMTSPPCQAFSLAGKRKGETDKRGILFYNSHEFIKKNNPRYFIFENVKGLLSDDNGKTFQRWLDYLGGKSINGNPVIFPLDDATPYHIYYQVLNAKHYGIPQNRERVFIIGIRDDADNDFCFPKPFHLEKRLKDVLEDEVDEKYFLSDKNIENLIAYNKRQVEENRGFSAKFRDVKKVETMDALKCGGGGKDDLIKVKSATKCGYEIATENDSINFSVPNSETRRGGVGKGVAQTLDTNCSQAILINNKNHEKSTLNQTNPIKELQSMWEEIRKETFKKWGTGITTPLQQEKILQFRLQEQVYDKNWFNESKPKSGSRNSEKHKKAFYQEELLREMWKGWETRYASYRRESPKQYIKELDVVMSKLPLIRSLNPTEDMQNEKLQNQDKSIRLLQQALSEIKKLWESDVCNTTNEDGRKSNLFGRLEDVKIGAFRGRNPKDPSNRTTGAPTEQRLEINQNGTSNTLTSVQKDNVVVYGNLKGGKWDKTHEQSRRVYNPEGIGATLHTMSGGGQHPKIAVKPLFNNKRLNQTIEKKGIPQKTTLINSYNKIYNTEISHTISARVDANNETSLFKDFKIRKLTPRECFRLMDFPDTFTWPVSNSQAYKQAGNSICVGVLVEIIKKLNL